MPAGNERGACVLMKIYFPDTNFFFECRKVSDLPWHELEGVAAADATEVRLIVPSPVITEIDRHKQRGNSRTAKRAREASALLRQALSSLGNTVEVRAANPRVTLSLPPVVRTDPITYPSLDPSRADHRIILECVELLKAEPNLRLLTDDTLLVLAARSIGLEPILIPDGWKLAAEKDERDDELDRLRNELRTHKQNAPDLAFTLRDAEGAEVSSIEIQVPVFDVSDAAIDEGAAAVASAYPMETDFRKSARATHFLRSALDPLGHWRPPTEGEIERYKSEQYPNWRENLRKVLPTLAFRTTKAASEALFTVSIANTGLVNATNARLFIDGFDGVLVHDPLDDEDRDKREKGLLIPNPPSPPRGRHVSIGHIANPITPIMRDFPGLMRPPRRDPSSFYHVDRPSTPDASLQLTCDALPHQSKDYNLDFRLLFSHDELANKPRVRVRLEASNLRKPIEKFLTVSVTVQPTSFKDLLEKLLGFPI